MLGYCDVLQVRCICKGAVPPHDLVVSYFRIYRNPDSVEAHPSER